MNYDSELAGFKKIIGDLDPALLRSAPEEMRLALRDVVAAGEQLWNAPMPTLAAALVETARVDLTLARLVEGHADAMRILDQADEQARPGVYGVWASRSVGTGVAGQFREGRWTVRGELRFASGVELLDRALIPVWVDEGHHQLLDLSLAEGTFTADPSSWRTAAMDASQSWTVHVDTEASINATVGPQDWYLDRPGFVVGGLGVAAVWAGGAQHLLDLLVRAVHDHPTTAAGLRRLGLVDQAVWEARTAVEQVADRIEGMGNHRIDIEVSRARMTAAVAAERVVAEAAHIVGPGGLSRNERLIRASQDLGIYVRQLALDADLEARGRRIAHETQPSA